MHFTIYATAGFIFGKPSRWVTYAIKSGTLRLWTILYRTLNPLFIVFVVLSFFWLVFQSAKDLKGDGSAARFDLFFQDMLTWFIIAMIAMVVVVTTRSIRDQIAFTRKVLVRSDYPKYLKYLVMDTEFLYKALFPTDGALSAFKDDSRLHVGIEGILSQSSIIEARLALLKVPNGIEEAAAQYKLKLRLIELVSDMYQSTGLYIVHSIISDELHAIEVVLSEEMTEAASAELKKLEKEEFAVRLKAQTELTAPKAKKTFAKTTHALGLAVAEQ